MDFLGYHITLEFVVSVFLHMFGAWLLYKNRVDLLYDDEDNNRGTPNTLSPSRCWSWLLFYLAFSYWLRYLMGMIPPTTPFPPGLQEMLYACLLYEFAKKGIDVSKILLKGKYGGGWGHNYPCRDDSYRDEHFNEYAGSSNPGNPDESCSSNYSANDDDKRPR